MLKGHSYENVCEIIALNDRLESNRGPGIYFNFFKKSVIVVGFLKFLILLNKMGWLDWPKLVAISGYLKKLKYVRGPQFGFNLSFKAISSHMFS
jgi:hypothetical protein